MANKQFCNRNYHCHTNVHIYLVTKEIISTRTHTHTYIYNNNFIQDGNKYIQKFNMSSPRGVARRKTKLRGQITSPDTSPVRRGGGMSMTL